MQKDTFYRCMRSGKTGQAFALKTAGYTDGDIGLHKENGFWYATHLPTGMKITPADSLNKKRTDALKEAKNRIIEKSDLDAHIQKILSSNNYQAFSQSRYAQECFTVL